MTIRPASAADLPDLARYTGAVAMTPRRWGSSRCATGSAWCSLARRRLRDVVQIGREIGPAPNLKALLGDTTS